MTHGWQQLDAAVLRAAQRLEAVADEDERARRAAALEHLSEYVSLLRTAQRQRAASAVRVQLKLEWADGRWDVDEAALPAAPQVGDVVDLGERGSWQIRAAATVRAAVARVTEREYFVCAPAEAV